MLLLPSALSTELELLLPGAGAAPGTLGAAAPRDEQCRQHQAAPGHSCHQHHAGNAEEAPSEPSWDLGRAVPAEGEVRGVQGENSH